MAREKVNSKIYSEDEFFALTSEKVEKTKYDVVWTSLFEKIKGKSLNTAYLKEEFCKIAKHENIEIPEYLDSILYGRMKRLITKGKVKKAYDGRIVVYKFL